MTNYEEQILWLHIRKRSQKRIRKWRNNNNNNHERKRGKKGFNKSIRERKSFDFPNSDSIVCTLSGQKYVTLIMWLFF